VGQKKKKCMYKFIHIYKHTQKMHLDSRVRKAIVEASTIISFEINFKIEHDNNAKPAP